MNITPEYVSLVSSLAQEIETEDPIDWGMLSISEQDTYQLMTINVLEAFGNKYNDPNFREIMFATVVKLVVENFTLNLKLRGK
jgi:hypothetical protein